MHRYIMECNDPNMVVDHKFGNRLDNRKSKLRICTPNDNLQNHKVISTNTSGYTGVSWDQRRGVWLSRITSRCQYHFLGYYDDINDAIVARKAAEVKYQGKFAYKGSA